MKWDGISDSPAPSLQRTAACEACGSEARLEGGSCVSCLLLAALDDAEETPGPENLQWVLAGCEVREQQWKLGNYQILEEIGRGGMGVIYRARQRYSKRVVALKRVLSYHGDSRETLERFRREAEAAASLDHPNILPIYEVGEADGMPFFTMKYAAGGSLSRAAAVLRADPRECVRLMAKVARAVAYAHREGLLHRDLKPGNILLDSRGEPLVIDFGLAKWMDADADVTRSLAIFGTPAFIAPEQAHGSRSAVGPAADIYSLGAVLFDLLAGRPPFLGDHAIAVIRDAAEKGAPKLRSIDPNIDRDLETICGKCLEREPDARYGSAAELAEDLERWLDGRPIRARRTPLVMRSARWVRRNRVHTATFILCILIGGAAVTRQMQGKRMQGELTARAAAQHSVQVLPFLDVDNAQPCTDWTTRLAQEFRQHLQTFGPATVHLLGEGPHREAGTGADGAGGPYRTLLSGTIRRVDGQIRISLHLLRGSDRAPLLHEVVMADAKGAAAAVSRHVGRNVYSILSTADLTTVTPPTSDPGLLAPDARSFIQQGLELASRRGGLDLDRSIACLEHAIALQPGSSAAHAALARALGYKIAYRTTQEPLERALEAARQAVALDPRSGDAHLDHAAVLYHAGRVSEAIEANKVALEHSPSARRSIRLISNIYDAIGRPDLATAWFTLPIGGQPIFAGPSAHIGDCHAYMLQDDRAEAAYQHYFKLHPEQPEGWMGLCRLHLLNGRTHEARLVAQQHSSSYRDFTYAVQMEAQVEFFGRDFAKAEELYARLYERDPSGGRNFYGGVAFASALGRIRSGSDPAAGKKLLEEARESELRGLRNAAERPLPFYHLAAIESSLGNTEAALHHLAAATNAGWIDYRSMAIDPRFDAIRDEPAFQHSSSTMRRRAEELKLNWSRIESARAQTN